MWQSHCFSCEEALTQVIIPFRRQRHIIRRHYSRPGYGRSFFFQQVMSSHTLFIRVINELCSGLQPSQVQEMPREGRRMVRHLYYLKFGFAVGVCQNRGGIRQTDTIKIVCDTTECRECNRRWARKVVTIYPC